MSARKISKSLAILIALLLLPMQAPAQATALTCAQGGVCVVGDTGPGGGKVFFVKENSPFSKSITIPDISGDCITWSMCFPVNYSVTLSAESQTALDFDYLEVAPSWSVDQPWSQSNGVITDGVGSNIGSGSSNTTKIVAQFNSDNPSTNAAMYADSYVSNSKTDWFLPSDDEFILILILSYEAANNGGPSIGSFSDNYLTSSATDSGSAPWFNLTMYDQGSVTRVSGTAGQVLPVRAFSVRSSTSEAEIAAQAAADRKAAEAKREAMKQEARRIALKNFDEKSPNIFEVLTTAEIAGVTEKNIEAINNEILARSQADRSDLSVLMKTGEKYAIMDQIALGGMFRQIYPSQLGKCGLVPIIHQTSVTIILRKLPNDQKDTYEDIQLAITNQLKVIEDRKLRLASLLAKYPLK